MAEKAEAAQEVQAAGAKPKLDIKKLFLPIFLVVDLLVLGGGGFFAYNATLGYIHPKVREEEAIRDLLEQRKKDEAVGGLYYTMPELTVNLFGSPPRLVRLEMTFEMLDKEGFEEIVRNGPLARDAIVRILNDKTFADLETVQGKLFLKDQVSVALNKQFQAAVIKDIYFSQFLVQASK